MALYDAVCNYKPEEDYPGNVLVFESTAEPARSSENVAKRWARIATNVKIVAIEGSHMSIVGHRDGLPLARQLCQRLREVAVKDGPSIITTESADLTADACVQVGKLS